MKTTIKTAHGKVTAEPLPDGCIQLAVDQGMDYAIVELTPDQIGALLFAIEKAAEAAQIALDRAGAEA